MKIILIAVITILSILFFGAISVGIEKNEIKECHEWLAQSKEYRLYYFTDWQIEQCASHNIELK